MFSQNSDQSDRLNFESEVFFCVTLDVIYMAGSVLVGFVSKLAHKKQIEGLVL